MSWGYNYVCIQAGEHLPDLLWSKEWASEQTEGRKHPPHCSQLWEFCCLQQWGFLCCRGIILQPASHMGSWKAPMAQLAAGCPGANLRQSLRGTAPNKWVQLQIQSEWNSALASGISGCNSGGILSGSRDSTGQNVFSGFTWQMDSSEQRSALWGALVPAAPLALGPWLRSAHALLPGTCGAALHPLTTSLKMIRVRWGSQGTQAGSSCFAVLSAVSVGLPGPVLSEPISPAQSIVPGLRPPRGPADGQYRPSPTSWADQTACCFLLSLIVPCHWKRGLASASVWADRQQQSGKGAGEGGEGGKEEEGEELHYFYYRPGVYCCSEFIYLNPLEAGQITDYQTDKIKPPLF